MTLGEAFTIRINELLKERNVSLYKFLKENSIARSTIVNIANGKTKCPTLATVYQVAYAFSMTPVEFLSHPLFDGNEVDYL